LFRQTGILQKSLSEAAPGRDYLSFYFDGGRMINSNKIIERRSHERYQVQQGIYALLKNGASKLGQIINISAGGLAFMYINHEERIGEPVEVDIFISGNGYFLKGIPCKKISDIHVDNFVPFSTFEMRQLGIQFGSMNNGQAAQLDSFIKEYTLSQTI
jgi:PilZ domain